MGTSASWRPFSQPKHLNKPHPNWMSDLDNHNKPECLYVLGIKSPALTRSDRRRGLCPTLDGQAVRANYLPITHSTERGLDTIISALCK